MKTSPNGKNAQAQNLAEVGGFKDSHGRRTIRIAHPVETCPCGTCASVRDRQEQSRREFLLATRRELAIQWDGPNPECISKRFDLRTVRQEAGELQQQALRVLANAIIAEELLGAIGNGADPLECVELTRDRIRGVQAAASAILDLGIVREDVDRNPTPSRD